MKHVPDFFTSKTSQLECLLNGSKWIKMPIYCHPWFSSLSLHADSRSTCYCPYCAPFFHVSPREGSLDTPLVPLQSAKYLGSFITPTSSSVPDVNFRCSQAPLSRHWIHFFDILLSPKENKLRVYTNSSGHSPPWIGISNLLSRSNY